MGRTDATVRLDDSAWWWDVALQGVAAALIAGLFAAWLSWAVVRRTLTEQRRLAGIAASDQRRLAEESAAEQRRLADKAAVEHRRLAEKAAAEHRRLAEDAAAEQRDLARQSARASLELAATITREERARDRLVATETLAAEVYSRARTAQHSVVFDEGGTAAAWRVLEPIVRAGTELQVRTAPSWPADAEAIEQALTRLNGVLVRVKVDGPQTGNNQADTSMALRELERAVGAWLRDHGFADRPAGS